MFFWKREPPPPPPPIPFYRKPAVVSIILTVIIVFVLGPVGFIFNGMTEELEKKADNETVILLIKQIKENDDRQWKEIEQNRQQQAPAPPRNVQITGSAAVMNPVQTHEGVKALSFKDFKEYRNAIKEDQEAFRETRPEVDWNRYKRWTK